MKKRNVRSFSRPRFRWRDKTLKIPRSLKRVSWEPSGHEIRSSPAAVPQRRPHHLLSGATINVVRPRSCFVRVVRTRFNTRLAFNVGHLGRNHIRGLPTAYHCPNTWTEIHAPPESSPAQFGDVAVPPPRNFCDGPPSPLLRIGTAVIRMTRPRPCRARLHMLCRTAVAVGNRSDATPGAAPGLRTTLSDFAHRHYWASVVRNDSN